jgi:hypothetical protein
MKITKTTASRMKDIQKKVIKDLDSEDQTGIIW